MTLYRILAINPGSTSTKIGLFENRDTVFEKKIEHQGNDLRGFDRVADQYPYRRDLVLKCLEQRGIPLESLHGIAARGGLLRPVAGGTYLINETMRQDLLEAKRGEHASNLAPLIAFDIAEMIKVPAFIVDPVAVDELEAVARLSGWKEIERESLSHALNAKAVARKTAELMAKSYEEINLVVAHLGSGISVSAHRLGRMIDVNNAVAEGPFSPERCGGLPSVALVRLCFSGRYTEQEVLKVLFSEGGIFSYLRTKDIRKAEEMAKQGHQDAALVLDALTYQVAKEIGAMSTVLAGQVDRIVLTGGMAHSSTIVDKIKHRVGFLAPVVVMAGEEELNALAWGALRVLSGQETARQYN